MYYWPPSVPKHETLDAFIAAYATLGYSVCEDGLLEPDFEKIAIFVGATGRPTHASRQLQDGQWTSKLGKAHDISHVLEEVGGFRCSSYGRIAVFMKRSC
jgi:hypothetical protein